MFHKQQANILGASQSTTTKLYEKGEKVYGCRGNIITLLNHIYFKFFGRNLSVQKPSFSQTKDWNIRFKMGVIEVCIQDQWWSWKGMIIISSIELFIYEYYRFDKILILNIPKKCVGCEFQVCTDELQRNQQSQDFRESIQEIIVSLDITIVEGDEGSLYSDCLPILMPFYLIRVPSQLMGHIVDWYQQQNRHDSINIAVLVFFLAKPLIESKLLHSSQEVRLRHQIELLLLQSRKEVLQLGQQFPVHSLQVYVLGTQYFYAGRVAFCEMLEQSLDLGSRIDTFQWFGWLFY